jgi:hypothetical protein
MLTILGSIVNMSYFLGGGGGGIWPLTGYDNFHFDNE